MDKKLALWLVFGTMAVVLLVFDGQDGGSPADQVLVASAPPPPTPSATDATAGMDADAGWADESTDRWFAYDDGAGASDDNETIELAAYQPEEPGWGNEDTIGRAAGRPAPSYQGIPTYSDARPGFFAGRSFDPRLRTYEAS